MADELLYWVWLSSAKRMNTFKITNILERFRTPDEVYNASIDDLCVVKGITSHDVKALGDKSLERAETIIRSMEDMGVSIVTVDSPLYPYPFRLMADPPYVLYMKGRGLDWEHMLGLTVIGTRMYSQYGADVTRFMCEPLAKAGFTIISGMANGVDGAAARAALDVGASTVAVLGSGIDVIYPRENIDLFNRIVQNGVVMTEYAPGTRPYPNNFPHRNRLMSALGRGVLVTEAPERSGSLITASQALDMGRNVFAVPGSVFSENCDGTNLLIQQGAKAVMHPRDVMCEFFADTRAVDNVRAKDYDSSKNVKENYSDNADFVHGSQKQPKKKNKTAKNTASDSGGGEKNSASLNTDGLNENEKKIISLLKEKNYTADELSRALGMKINELNNILVFLEIRGFISRLAGNNYKIN